MTDTEMVKREASSASPLELLSSLPAALTSRFAAGFSEPEPYG